MAVKFSPAGLTSLSYLASLAVHSAAFALLLWAGKSTPALHKGSPGGPPQNSAAASAVEPMREQVKELLTIESELERTRAAREAQYRRWADREKQQAPDDIKARLKAADEQLETAQTQMQRAAQQHAELKASADALAGKPVQAALTQQSAAMVQKALQVEQQTAQAREATNRAVVSQREAIQTINFAGDIDASLRPALENSVHLGEQATGAQGTVLEMQHTASEALKNWRDAEKALKSALETADRAAAAARRVEAAARRAEAKKAAEAARRAQAVAKSLAAAAKRKEGAGGTPSAPPKPPETAANKPAAPSKPVPASSGSPVPVDTPEVAAKRNDARQKLAAAVQALNAALQAHTQATGAHAGARQAAQTARAYAETHLASRNPSAEIPGAHHAGDGPETPGLSPAAVTGRSAAELYSIAVKSEQHSAEAFRQIRGVETAMAERTTLENALANLDSETPVRPALKTGGVLADVFASQSEIDQDTEKAQNEVRSILEAGRRIREHSHHGLAVSGPATPGGNARGASVSLATLNQAVTSQAESRLLAQEEDLHPAKDLTAWMKSTEKPKSKGGSKLAGATPGIAGGAGTDAVKQSPQAGPDVVNSAEIPVIPPAQEFHALPGRRMAAGGTRTDWMFVDSWYIVGPFPNPQRANVNRSFPPETDIDLDAVYSGKDNRTVRWRFAQAGGPMIVPPDAEEYAIYYGTTELWFDTPRDLWIALGSDDKSHVWINDHLVWVSSDVLKGWRLNEGWRKVHFRQGRNRVLFRLENGWRGTGFSLLIHIK